MNLVDEYEVECPYCGEPFAISVDTTQGNYEMTEDCAVSTTWPFSITTTRSQ